MTLFSAGTSAPKVPHCSFLLSDHPRSCVIPVQDALVTWENLTLMHSWNKRIYSLTSVTGAHGAHIQAQSDVLD